MESDISPQVSDGSNARQVSSATLLIVGEPVDADHKNLILAEITKGLRCWECEDVDINEELSHIANAAELGVEGPNGERVLNYGTEKMATMIVVNSHLETLTAALKNFLSLSAPYKHLIYAGHYFSGNGGWVLQDDIFSISNFAQMCKDKELEESMKGLNGGQVNFYFSKGGEWKEDSLKKLDIFKNTVVKVNAVEKVSNAHGILQFVAYVSNFINAKTSEDLLRTSDVVGVIRFNKPTLYIFPGSEGDSALFGISGFNLLVNGGYSRKACFWDLTRHVDRIDALLMTHLGTDNVFGISTLLKRKSSEYIHPEIGYMYLNGSDKVSHSAVVNGDKEPSLCINLSEEGSRLIEYAKQLGHVPQPLTRPMSSQPLQPINLYHKVGHGSLNMYVLNPVSDSKELKDFYQHWNKHLSEHGSMHQIPVQNQLSVCTLLVWQPADPNEKISRIFFPGNAPQHKILEGLEKLKHLDILKHVSCTAKDLQHKPASAAAKRNSLPARPVSSKAPFKASEPVKSTKPPSDIIRKSADVRASTEHKPTALVDRKKPEPKKEETKAPPPSKPKVPSVPKTNKVTKEDKNKETAKKDDKLGKTAKTPPANNKTTPKTKTETKKKDPKQAHEKVDKKAEEKSAEVEEKKEIIAKPPEGDEKKETIEEPPVAVVEPMTDKPLLDLSPQEPATDTNLIGESEEAEVKPDTPDQPSDAAEDNTQSDHSPQYDDLMGMGTGSKMMESFHEGYNGDLMSNGTPTEEREQNLSNYGIYDDNVDIQPEALPEPVEIPPQQTFTRPDMIPTNDRKNQEEKPLISGMAPIEPDVVQGLQNETEDSSAKTSTPLDDKPPVDFDTSEKSLITPESEQVEPKPEDPMQQSLFGGDLGPDQGSEALESFTESESVMSSRAADAQDLDQTGEDLMQKSLTTSQEQIFDKQEDDVTMETEMQGENPPDVVQVQEKFEDENIVETQNKIQEIAGDVDEDEVSPDENDSQVDVSERNLEDMENEQTKFDEEKNVDDESPYAFENRGFQDGSAVQDDESYSEKQETEGVAEDQQKAEECESRESSPEQQRSISPDEGVIEEEDEDVENYRESGVGIEVHDEGRYDNEEEQERPEENQEHYNDSLEVSNIPEAFEKDETPDPREVQAGISPEPLHERPMESMDPYDPFCSTSPNMAAMQSSNPFDNFPDKSSSEGLVEDSKPLNGFEFDPYASQGQHPFDGVSKQNVNFEEEESELKTNPFDPEAEWGKPMGLPSPPPPDVAGDKSATKKPATKQSDHGKNGVKKDPAATSRTKASGKLDTSVNGPGNKLNTSRARPASAAEPKAKPPPATGKRPASAAIGSSRSSPAVKTPPLPPFTPFYVDLTYIPNHGNPSYSDIEFFKRVRARYYVLSSLSPNPRTLTALMEAKQTWENKNTEVTLIPTYDNDTLRHWMGLNRDKLNELNIDVAPSANRSTIHLQDHETSCSAYRLEF